MTLSKKVYDAHIGGKINVELKTPINTMEDLAVVYTPGVAEVCMKIYNEPNYDHTLTIKRNSVAVVTDGTAVLGLGDIGPAASMPVMEGKAALFKQLADVDAYPIAIDTKGKTNDEVVEIIRSISYGFGGINLEDIAAPKCFDIEAKLKKATDIPVFHDDQHGTAVVALAALYNALKITGKKLEDLKIVMSGVGAAGVACTKIILNAGAKNIIGCDRTGAIYQGRKEGMNSVKEDFATYTNPNKEQGSLKDVLKGADMFIGVSGPDLFGEEELKTMNKDPIIFAMSNPTPEVPYDIAKKHAAIVATGRSDYPNQINNVLCFPGLFRGLLDCNAHSVTEKMKVEAAKAIASCVPEDKLHADFIVPDIFNQEVVTKVADAVIKCAKEEGVCKEIKAGNPFLSETAPPVPATV